MMGSMVDDIHNLVDNPIGFDTNLNKTTNLETVPDLSTISPFKELEV